jgi:allophanate hydrolase
VLGPSDSLDISTLGARYRAATLDPISLVDAILARIAQRGKDAVWIHLTPPGKLRAIAAELAAAGPKGKPLYGIPFAIKDNIDLARSPTTAGCPDFAYVPKDSACVVERLVAAGALPIGKTNLDQFATGLNGTRSPYGSPISPFDPASVPGGSSSGSAVAVATGLASFSLGTDTAGSGRVPAAFNNIVGLKPTRGLLSTSGVVPACRSLDCVSIFALTCEDARTVLDIAEGLDARDPFARPKPAGAGKLPHSFAGLKVGVPRPRELKFFGAKAGATLFKAALKRATDLGATLVEIELAPFLEAARLLYEGPWVAERYAAVGEFVRRHPNSVLPVTRKIILGGAKPSGVDTFAAIYRLEALKRATEATFRTIDVLMTPTAGRSYTIAALRADPIRLNSELGYYTNFMNLLDLAAIALPAGFEPNGFPFGVTLAAPAFEDEALLALGDALHRAADLRLGATKVELPAHAPSTKAPAAQPAAAFVRVAVCGAHMQGLPLNPQLTERGARLVHRGHTARHYRLYALPGGPPARPGLVRAERGGAIEVEVWEMPAERFGSFVDAIPQPLGIGTIELDDGSTVRGFLCEAYAVAGAHDITSLGGWRAYLASERASAEMQQQQQ